MSKSVRQIQSGAAASNSQALPQPSLSSQHTVQGSNLSRAAGAAPNSFPEQLIQKLVNLGYSRPDVIAALTEANGDEAKAQMILFAKAFKM